MVSMILLPVSYIFSVLLFFFFLNFLLDRDSLSLASLELAI